MSKSYRSIKQYEFDRNDLDDSRDKRAVKVVKALRMDQSEPREESLRFYNRTKEHAADWNLAAKFKTLKSLEKHSAIISCLDWFEDPFYLNYLVAFEPLSGGSLLDRLQAYHSREAFVETSAQSAMKQIFSGVKFLHKQHIVHRGLWLENFVYRRKGESTIKIANWDYAMQAKTDQELHFLSDKHLFDNKRPLCSYSPEMIQASLQSKDEKKEGYGRPSDLWALGVCLYMICAFRVPVQVPESELHDVHDPESNLHDRKENYLKIVSETQIPYRSEDWVRVSKEAKDLVEKLLCVDPQSRITIEKALDHKWITASDLKPADGGGIRDLGLAFANKNCRRK